MSVSGSRRVPLPVPGMVGAMNWHGTLNGRLFEVMPAEHCLVARVRDAAEAAVRRRDQRGGSIRPTGIDCAHATVAKHDNVAAKRKGRWGRDVRGCIDRVGGQGERRGASRVAVPRA